ncbi:MAG: undecaprenyl-diphosphate phosphatase, partial [Ruthenibacterium sp.]
IARITYPMALGIGVFQVLSLIPGTSRSGATIIGAMLLGCSRTIAAEFTFFLAVPVMFGASLIKLLKFGFAFTGLEIGVLAVGMVTAFIVSVLSIRFLMRYVKNHDFKVFGWYRIALGALVLLYFYVLK